MTLPAATLFPESLLPLYIFEPRYRRMLSDILGSTRMFSVAMQRPGQTREMPCQVAGLGLVRISVGHADGTSHLILQGLTRVRLGETVQYKPYRVQTIRMLETEPVDNVMVDALLEKVFELVKQRLEFGGVPVPSGWAGTGSTPAGTGQAMANTKAIADLMSRLENLANPDAVSDMVACTILSNPLERQIILETLDLEQRLKHLIHFLLAEIRVLQKHRPP